MTFEAPSHRERKGPFRPPFRTLYHFDDRFASGHPSLTSPAAASPLASAPNDTDETTFVIRATGLLHSFGTPAHRLERVVVQVARHFDLDVQVFSTPTSIFLGFALGVPDRVRLLRVEPGGVHLGKLVDLDELMEEVTTGRLTPAQGLVRLDEIQEAIPGWSRTSVTAGHALAAGTAAVFFGGSLLDVGLSFVLGAVIGLLEIVAARQQGVASIFEPLAAFTAAAVALAASDLSGGAVNDGVVALASIIVLIPGLSLTVALLELATRNLASGTARLAGAATVFLTIGFGALLGRLAVHQVLGRGEPMALAVQEEWLGTAPVLAGTLLLASLGFALLFRVRPKELGWVIAGCAFGFVSARIAHDLAAGARVEAGVTPIETAAISAFAGAFAVALFSNAYARFRNRPATVPLVPGLLVLVPGSVGYRALNALAEQDTLTGLETAFQMVLLAAALVGGMLTASAILPPRRHL